MQHSALPQNLLPCGAEIGYTLPSAMFLRKTALLQALASLSLLACDGPSTKLKASIPPQVAPQPSATASAASVPVAPPAPPLPPGVLAMIPSKSGMVKVEESGAFRLLTVDGVVHAAHFKESADAPLAPFDPLVSLLEDLRSGGRGKALVLGLGSGVTATELKSFGYDVEVAEIEPAVIDVARRFFDYQGHAEAIDGLEFLRREGKPYDLILLDAFAGTNVAPSLVHADVTNLLRKKLNPRGVVAVRLLGSPKEPHILAALRTFADAFANKRLLGTGVADEPQNLYLVLSDHPLRIFDLNVGPVFPLPWPDATAAVAATDETGRREVVLGQKPRRAALLGYLIRGEDGNLCLDLPHWEMGARRYILKGASVASLQKLLPAKFTFPTQGDLSTDGDVKKTLHSLLGGGGVKLNTVRFSPIAVAVEGNLLPPKEGTRSKVVLPKGPPTGSGLRDPFDAGTFMREIKEINTNVQGEIDVDRVLFTLDMQQWKDFRQKTLRPLAAKGTKALHDGHFHEGQNSIKAMLAALEAKFGRFAPRIVTYDELLALHDVLGVYAPKQTEAAEPQAGVECDRARTHYRMDYTAQFWSTDEGNERRDLGAMLAALYECALVYYEKGAGKTPKSEVAKAQAARLIGLLDDAEWDEYDERKRDALRKRSATLREQWDIEGKDDPL